MKGKGASAAYSKLLAILALFLIASCAFPTWSAAKREAIGTESRSLMARIVVTPEQPGHQLPPDQWPHEIASLNPVSVTVEWWGVDIVTKSWMDGGWGYHIPRDSNVLPMPRGCYSEIADGVFWHEPC
ncbi:hypothetical protein [Sphingosinithalassobacter portus]|uniref:hypothetical protein n=1 Tax=Stakelama portus TaxID=2676234 RepID=UPI000D6E0A5B|nr:hypothetical protein [Sphingosinithalassobacter portus]